MTPLIVLKCNKERKREREREREREKEREKERERESKIFPEAATGCVL